MTQTDYFLILASLVIGLALTELLQGLAQLIREWRSAKTYWVHSLTAANVFFFLLQFWWASWNWREAQGWTPSGLLLLMLGMTALYLMAYLIYPDRLKDVKLREHYFAHARSLWLMVAAYMAIGLLAPHWILGWAWALSPVVMQQLLGVGLALSLAFWRNPWWHGAVVTAMFLINLSMFVS